MNIVKNISINSAIGVISKIFSFALLPYILEIIPLTLYGQYGLLLTIILWFEKVSVGPFTNGLARWYHKKEIGTNKFSVIFFTSIILTFIFSILGATILYFSGRMSSFIILILVILSTVSCSYLESALRFTGKHKNVAIYVGIRNIVIPMGQLILLKMHTSFDSLIIGIIIGNVIFLICGYKTLVIILVKIQFRLKTLKDMLIYSIPLIIIGISVTSFFLFDRYLVKITFGYEVLGELTLAHQIAGIMSIAIATPIKQVVVPEILALEKEGDRYEKIVSKMYPLTFFLSISAIMGVYFFHDNLLYFLDNEGNIYVDSYLVFLILFYHFLSILSVFYKAPFLLVDKTRIISIVSFIAMVISGLFMVYFIQIYELITLGYSYIIMVLLPIIFLRSTNREIYKFPSKILLFEFLIVVILILSVFYNQLFFYA